MSRWRCRSCNVIATVDEYVFGNDAALKCSRHRMTSVSKNQTRRFNFKAGNFLICTFVSVLEKMFAELVIARALEIEKACIKTGKLFGILRPLHLFAVVVEDNLIGKSKLSITCTAIRALLGLHCSTSYGQPWSGRGSKGGANIGPRCARKVQSNFEDVRSSSSSFLKRLASLSLKSSANK